MAEVTLRLPEELHRRLAAASEQRGASLNELIISALSEVLRSEQASDSLAKQVERLRETLGDLLVEVDLRLLPPSPSSSGDLPDVDAPRQPMPALAPPLSATIIADRHDRC